MGSKISEIDISHTRGNITIKAGAFWSGGHINKIDIETTNSLVIENNAFSAAMTMASCDDGIVNLAASSLKIGSKGFHDCTMMKEITLKGELKEIESDSFEGAGKRAEWGGNSQNRKLIVRCNSENAKKLTDIIKDCDIEIID